MLAFMTANEAAEKWNISHRRVLTLCRENRIADVAMLGNMWIIPIDAQKPEDARSRRYIDSEEKVVKPFLKWAGGKGQLLKEIERYYPFTEGSITKYAEPFVGGGAVNASTCQILADCTGKKVETVPSPQNVGAVGAAVVSAVGLGVSDSIDDAGKLIKVDKIFKPNPENKAVYDKNFKAYKELYKANKNIFEILNG